MCVPPILALLLLLTPLPAQRPTSEVPSEMKLRMVELINEDRKAAGVASVGFSEELSRVADEHCREMLRERYTSHWNRAGWKPYLRYSATGLSAYTSENISMLWETAFPSDAVNLWGNLRYAHRSFMFETPPNDGHRRSILDPHNTVVGIGVAYNEREMRLIEVYGASYAEIEPLPQKAHLRDALSIRGRVRDPGLSLMSIAVYYEPLPKAMSVEELRGTSSYSLPNEEFQERPKLPKGITYADRTRGVVELDEHGAFTAPLMFWKGQPGVYTVAVWLRRGKERPFIGALVPVQVDSR